MKTKGQICRDLGGGVASRRVLRMSLSRFVKAIGNMPSPQIVRLFKVIIS